MKRCRVLTGLLVWLAVVGLCAPPTVLAAVGSKPVPHDVALLEGGVLVGQVVNEQGVAKAGVPVVLQLQDRSVASPRTDGHGYFAVRGVRAGVYHIASNNGHGAYRLWAPGTAPPTAQRGALVVDGAPVARGQYGGGKGFPALFANPWIVAGVVATAVAVPVAVHNSQRSTPTSP